MKEKIYEIPVNEAFEKDCECAVCALEQALEENTVDFLLGPSMMEPDYRTQTNQKGFCRRHLRLLFRAQNKLPLALMLDTHVAELAKNLDKKGLFSKKEPPRPTCAACDKMNFVMDKYLDVIFYLWKTKPGFAETVEGSRGFCMPHYRLLSQAAARFLSKKDAADFCRRLTAVQKRELLRLREEIHWFTQKFDYKNEDKPWGTSKDAPIRTVEKLGGYLEQE